MPKLAWLKHKKIIVPLVFLVSALVAVGLYYLNRPVPPAKTPIVTYSTDEPNEGKPDKNFHWQGAANDPKYIRLPTIQTEGFIQNVGVDQHKEMAAPNNIHFAGWFADSVRPGQIGLSIIDGHVDGREEAGIFRWLDDLKVHNEYSIEMGDGSLKRYQVKDVVTVDAQEAASALFSQNPDIKSQLNLITCGGSFDQQSRQYDKRVIVISEFID
jgi:hypothetical protein